MIDNFTCNSSYRFIRGKKSTSLVFRNESLRPISQSHLPLASVFLFRPTTGCTFFGGRPEMKCRFVSAARSMTAVLHFNINVFVRPFKE